MLQAALAEVIVGVLWFAIRLVVVAVCLQQLLCFTIALYETLNLPAGRAIRLTPQALVAAARTFAIEALAASAVVLALPLGLFPWPRVPRLPIGAHPPIIFVPGRAMNRICFLLLRQRLRRDGWIHAVGVNHHFLRADIVAAAAQLREVVEAVCHASGAARVVLVAHGLGGLVCRAYLRHHGGLSRATHVVTLGTPHQGSKICALSLDPTMQDVRDGSAFLQALAENDPIPAAVDFTAIYASFDALVVPAANGQYPGASNIEVEGPGHLGLLWSRRVYTLVRENLDYGSGGNASTQRATSSPSQ